MRQPLQSLLAHSRLPRHYPGSPSQQGLTWHRERHDASRDRLGQALYFQLAGALGNIRGGSRNLAMMA